MGACIISTILINNSLCDVIVICFVYNREVYFSLVCSCRTTRFDIQEMVISEENTFTRASTQLIANKYIAVLQYCEVIDSSSACCTGETHQREN